MNTTQAENLKFILRLYMNFNQDCMRGLNTEILGISTLEAVTYAVPFSFPLKTSWEVSMGIKAKMFLRCVTWF